MSKYGNGSNATRTQPANQLSMKKRSRGTAIHSVKYREAVVMCFFCFVPYAKQ